MHDDSTNFDDVEQLLSVPTHGAGNDVLRERLRRQTTARVGRHRRTRTLRWAAAVVLAYGAGVATHHLVSRQHVETRPVAVVTPSLPKESTEEWVELDELVKEPPERTDVPSAYQRLRKAGDRQLLDRGDVAAALRLYRRALNTASAAELTQRDATETWLLAALKTDRQQAQTEGAPQ